MYDAGLIWFSERKLGWKSVSDENERTPEVEPKSTNPRQEDKKGEAVTYVAYVVLHPQFYTGGGQKMAILGIQHVLTPKTPL